ncbi:MAG: PIN domain-containing protein [Pirellulales bacterium]
MSFVDTGAWYALATPSDPDHLAAKDFVASITEPFLTSDYVVDELLTLFGVRSQKAQGIEWKRDVLERGGADLVRVSDEDFAGALRIYEQFQDKAWSFTDCASYVVMQRLKVDQAFSFDHHFRQFGLVTVVPSLPSSG